MPVEDAWYMIDRATGDKVPTKRNGRGKRWRVRNRGARTVSFHKKSDAEAYDTSVKGDLLRGVTPFDRAAGRVLFKDYARKCVKERYTNKNSLRTSESRLENHLTPYFGEKRMCDIRPSTVSSWRTDMRGKSIAPRTFQAVNTLLVMIMRSAMTDKILAENPCTSATPVPPLVKRKVQIWEQEIVDRLLAKVSDRVYPIPLLAATCGHRRGEAFAVARGDVNFLRKEITINHQVQTDDGELVLIPPKGDKTRTVPLPNVTSMALAEHLRLHDTITVRCRCCDADHEILFSHKGKLISHNVWPEMWHPAVIAAGLTPSRRNGLHQLRHYYASTLIEGGASMEQVRDYMGHASIVITAEVYGHLFKRSHEKARNIIDQAFSARAYPVRTAQDQ